MSLLDQDIDNELIQNLLKLEESEPVLISRDTKIPNKIFGESDKQNITILKNIDDENKNDYAIPKPGESYGMVRKKLIRNKQPYHIAFVLYQHEGINITIESEAENGNNFLPNFCFYDTDPQKFTFYRRWSGLIYDANKKDPRYYGLYGKTSDTIVLQPRKWSDIKDTIEEEIRLDLERRNINKEPPPAAKKTPSPPAKKTPSPPAKKTPSPPAKKTPSPPAKKTPSPPAKNSIKKVNAGKPYKMNRRKSIKISTVTKA